MIYVVLCVESSCDRCGALGEMFLCSVVVLCGASIDTFMYQTFTFTIESLEQTKIHYFCKLTTKSVRIHNNTFIVTSGV